MYIYIYMPIYIGIYIYTHGCLCIDFLVRNRGCAAVGQPPGRRGPGAPCDLSIRIIIIIIISSSSSSSSSTIDYNELSIVTIKY